MLTASWQLPLQLRAGRTDDLPTVAKFMSPLLCVAVLFTSSISYAAQNYTDQEVACIRVCRDDRKCFGSPEARDNSPRCKKCVSDCARAQKKNR